MLLLVVLFWSICAYASLWQRWLWSTAQEAITKCEGLGFAVEASGLRPRVVLVGQYEEKGVVIQLEGGIFGEYTTFIVERRKVIFPLLKTSLDLELALNTFGQTSARSAPISTPQIE